MTDEFNLRSKYYWKKMGLGLFLGLIGAISALIFVSIVTIGQSIFLPHLTHDWKPFSGPYWIVIVMTIFGLLVGLIHRYTSARQMDVFGSLPNGHLDTKPIPSSIVASLLSLMGVSV